MNGRLPAPLTILLTTSAFLFALAGAGCLSGDRKPGGAGDTGGAGGEDDPVATGGKTGGYVSPDAAAGGVGDGTGGSVSTGGSKGTGGSVGTGGSSGKSDAGSAANGGSTGGDAGAAAPTFSEVYDKVLSMTPAMPLSSCWGPCHAGPGTVKAMMKFDATTKEKAYPGIMKLVIPGKAATSNLYLQISSGKMPEKKPKLPANLIKLVADWINAGAKND